MVAPAANLYAIFFLGTTCLPTQEGRRFFAFKRIRSPRTILIKEQQQ